MAWRGVACRRKEKDAQRATERKNREAFRAFLQTKVDAGEVRLLVSLL